MQKKNTRKESLELDKMMEVVAKKLRVKGANAQGMGSMTESYSPCTQSCC